MNMDTEDEKVRYEHFGSKKSLIREGEKELEVMNCGGLKVISRTSRRRCKMGCGIFIMIVFSFPASR
jgi:hypothetical protein